MYRSKDLREQAVRYRKAGHSAVETAEAFGTSDDTIYRWEKQFDDTGDLSTKKRSVRHSKIAPDELRKYVEENPDKMQTEIAEHFSVTPAAICKRLKQLRITRKKNNGLQGAGRKKGSRVP